MKYIVGNWKMHLGIRESVALARGVLRGLRGREDLPEVVLCPAFTALNEVNKVLARSRVSLGAQNCGPEKSGAYTGEVSAKMVKDTGCSHVIVGHSERRKYFGETDALARERLEMAFSENVTPILCVGEPQKERKAGNAVEYVLSQLKEALQDAAPRRKNLLVAYEPLWAIGTGDTATPDGAVEMHKQIRAMAIEQLGIHEKRLSVLYGGSVDADSAYDLLREKEVDGVLVGGASIKLKQFNGIIDAAGEVIHAQQL